MNCFSSIAMLVTVLSLVVFFHLEGTEAKRKYKTCVKCFCAKMTTNSL